MGAGSAARRATALAAVATGLTAALFAAPAPTPPGSFPPTPASDDRPPAAARSAADIPSARVAAPASPAAGPADEPRRPAVADTRVALPGGGQVLFPGRRLVALYGHPSAPALGALGEQGVAAAVDRARAQAAQYDPVVDEPVLPAFEIIATVADAAPGPDGDYSAEAPVAQLRPWVEAARAADMYVLLDLQPGRSEPLTQARRYAELLAEPHVGLALDPEWRLGPGQRHREQIGSVDVEEINAVVGWLADLTRDRQLPQKVLMVHQFRPAMIVGRERLDTTRDELAVVIHADGFGPPSDKLTTWDVLHRAEPPGVHWGWKNFYDEDRPPFGPAATMGLGLTAPVVVTYQ